MNSPQLVLDAVGAHPNGASESRNAFDIVERITRHLDATVLVQSDRAPAVAEGLAGRAHVVPVPWSPRMATQYFYLNWMDYSRSAARIVEALEVPVVCHRIMPFSIRYAGIRPANAEGYIVGPVGGSALPLRLAAWHPQAVAYQAMKLVEVTRMRTTSDLRRFYGGADAILASSTMSARRFRGVLAERTVLVTEGVDVPSYPVCAKSGRPVILFVGRLLWWKGAQYLLEALALITDLEWECRVVGDGPERLALESLVSRLGIKGRVSFDGWLDRPSVRQAMADAHICCFPSFNESVGMVNIEALATGTPVVAADWGGPADIITPECGMLVRPARPGRYVQGIAEALKSLLEDPDRRAAMGVAARARAEAVYDWSVVVETLLGLYARFGVTASMDNPAQDMGRG